MKSLFKFILNNFGRKLCAIFLAFLIWYLIDLQLNNRISYRDIPVTITTDPGYQIMDSGTQFVETIRLSGSPARIKAINSQDVKISIHVKAPEKLGRIQVGINKANVDIPNGMYIDEMFPEKVYVTIDQIKEKRVKVNVVTAGKLSEDFREVDSKRIVNPQVITISGPASIIRNIESVQTETEFFDAKVTSSFQKRLEVINPSDYTQINPAKVNAEFTIEEILSTKILKDIAIQILVDDLEEQVVLKNPLPLVKQITVQGTKEILAKTTEKNIKAFIDVSNFDKAGNYSIPVNLWFEDNRVVPIFYSPSLLEVELINRTIKL